MLVFFKLSICVFLFLSVPCASSRQIHLGNTVAHVPFNYFSFAELWLILYSLITLILSCTKFLKVRYLSFCTDLNTKSKFYASNSDMNNMWLIFTGIIVSDTSYDISMAWIVHSAPNFLPLFENLVIKILKRRRFLNLVCTFSLTLNLLMTSVSPTSHIL